MWLNFKGMRVDARLVPRYTLLQSQVTSLTRSGRVTAYEIIGNDRQSLPWRRPLRKWGTGCRAPTSVVEQNLIETLSTSGGAAVRDWCSCGVEELNGGSSVELISINFDNLRDPLHPALESWQGRIGSTAEEDVSLGFRPVEPVSLVSPDAEVRAALPRLEPWIRGRPGEGSAAMEGEHGGERRS